MGHPVAATCQQGAFSGSPGTVKPWEGSAASSHLPNCDTTVSREPRRARDDKFAVVKYFTRFCPNYPHLETAKC